jgi:SAM-dependent methyltransferase
MSENRWLQMIEQNPGHSAWYIERFRALEETGQDLVGEARLIDAMAPREGRILDAGCGFGRHAAWLHAQGHAVVGVDGDDELIADARALRPGATWLVQDLSELDLPSVGVTEPFDVILCAGNVVTFVAPSTRIEVLRRMGLHLAARGRLVVGFGLDRDYPLADFLADAAVAGLAVHSLHSTWELHPSTDDDDFVVAILGRAA